MHQYVVLNKNLQSVCPMQYDFFAKDRITDEMRADITSTTKFNDKAEAILFAEYLARNFPKERFTLAELLNTVQQQPLPVAWANQAISKTE